ncbi:MAG: molybdopterin cofactor-binding domain-containing protein [Pacificimonas sp.]|jgi:isoquinoline 1-oxidoreductase beta subunit|nr:molybdopterin cofactor-binding domain-containing protein [Pacificimonas sp.]
MDARTPTHAKPAEPKRQPNEKTGLTRRRLLIGAGGAAALAIGYAVWPRERVNPFPVRADERAVNAFLKFSDDGSITVAVPQAEMGQGVYTALPQLLAHELGADWQRIGVEPATLAPEYSNLAFVEGAGEGMPSLLAGIARWAAISVVERFEIQATGGSTSVMAFWEPLRTAGATARELLKAAAGRRLNLDPAELDTEGGFVVGGGQRVAFAELLDGIDPDDAPEAVAFRAVDPAGGGLLGKSVPRLDIPSKVNGTAQFGADVRLPGMVYGAVRGAPIGAERRVRYGPEPARALPGVVDVVADPEEGWHAVAAETWWQARQALDAVDAQYEGAGLADSEVIDAALAEALTDAARGTVFASRGAAEALEPALAGGLEAEYGAPFLAHACLEPMTATVRIEGDKAEVWAPTQSQTLTAWKAAAALDIPMRNVRVYPTMLGGGFGRKAEVDAVVQAALIAKAVDRPVQLIWHREQDMIHDKFRPPVLARLRGAVGPDKRMTALAVKVAAPNLGASMAKRMAPDMLKGFAGGGGDSASMVKGVGDFPYAVPNLSVSHADVQTPVPLGYWRAVEYSYAPFLTECFVDELAASEGVDPLEFRLRHLDPGGRAARVITLAASRGLLLGPVPEGTGRGLAYCESFGSHVAQVAEVEMIGGGQFAVKRVTCVVDCGQVVNPDIVAAQMEGGIIFGLSAALYGDVRFAGGETEQQNFDLYRMVSLFDAPAIDVEIVESMERPGGVGEPGTPPIAPAVANAVFRASGQRLRSMPFMGV